MIEAEHEIKGLKKEETVGHFVPVVAQPAGVEREASGNGYPAARSRAIIGKEIKYGGTIYEETKRIKDLFCSVVFAWVSGLFF